MILVDTSVWIDHFRSRGSRLEALLSNGEVQIHPAVIGELACGNLSRRSRVLAGLQNLPAAIAADAEETMVVIESRKLWGKGIGWTDAQLLASALLTGCVFWTLDRPLLRVASELGLGRGGPRG